MADDKDYAEITLDKPRRVRYRWQDVRELTRRLNGATLQGLLGKLAEADPETITVALQLGLRHAEPKLTIERVDEILDAYFRTDEGRLATVLAALNEALQACGLLRDRSKKPEDADGAARPQ